MTDFTDFPDDDQIWFIRHIDGYVKPHKGTESTSVRCHLAPIPARFGDDPAKLRRPQIQELFGRENPPSFVTTIFAGALPSYAVGLAFRRAEYVGCLPATQLPLGNALLQGEDSGLYKSDPVSHRPRPVTASAVIGQDESRWLFKVIPTSQLQLEGKVRDASEFLVVRDTRHPSESDQVEFLIPRTVIFRTFYASTSQRAEIFTAGPWSVVKGNAIYGGDFAGNTTGVNPETGEWNIVLQLGMEKADFHMMALCEFDEYARGRADLLHHPVLAAEGRARGNGDENLHWHSNAQIPYDPRRGPYTGLVSGYYLKRRQDRHFRGHTFLVSAIHSMSPPKGLPKTSGILINDSTLEGDITESDGPKPFGGKNRRRHKRPNDMPSGDTHQASNSKRAFDLPSLSFTLDPPPDVGELKKSRSTQYNGPRSPQPSDATAQGSSGNRDGHHESQSHFNSAQVDRPPSEVFAALMVSMEGLKSRGSIRAFSIVPPLESVRRAPVGAFACWNFLDNLQAHRRRRGHAPIRTRSWAYLGSTGTTAFPIERAALVLRIELPNGVSGLWIETEMHKKESFCSAFVIERGSGSAIEASTALRLIREAKGVALSRNLRRGGVICFSHPHFRESTNRTKWSMDPLVGFFKAVVTSTSLR